MPAPTHSTARETARRHAENVAASQGIVSSTPRVNPLATITRAHLYEISYPGEKPEGTDDTYLTITTHRHLSEVADDMVKLVPRSAAINDDPTITDAAAYLQIGESVERAVEDKCGLLEVHGERLTNRLDEVQAEIETLRQPAPSRAYLVPQLAETRAELRNMGEGKRYDFIAKAMQGPEAEVLAYAIASAPSFLSGITPVKHREMVDFVIGLRKPQLLGVEATLTANIARVHKAVEGLRRVFYGAIDRQRVKDIRARTTAGR